MAIPLNGYTERDDDYDLDGEIDYSDIHERYAVHYEDPLTRTIVVDGLPVVPADRQARFFTFFIQKFVGQRGFDVSEKDIDMPLDSNGSSKGFLFLTLPTAAQAADAVTRLSDSFDKKHSTTCVLMSAIPDIQNIQDEFEAPEDDSADFVPSEHRKGWLADPQGRDQMAVLRDRTLQIIWNHKGHKLDLDHTRDNWTEAYSQWSPSGAILATLHKQGLGLWGGPSFNRIQRFSHPGLNYLDFSPFERYVVTLSPVPIEAVGPFTPDNEGHHIAIWEIMTNTLVRTFPIDAGSDHQDGNGPADESVEKRKRVFTWPIFKWSPDERYFARVTPGQDISIYSVPSMTLLDRKRVKIEGVVDFDWAQLNDSDLAEVEDELRGGALVPEQPSAENKDAGKKAASKKKERENILAYWVPESQNQPARVSLMGIPSRETIRTKNLFNVSDCKLYWQNRGDYLCVRADRITRTKKATGSNLELFRLREKAIPIQVIEIKDTIIEFAWEPKGDRFALITSNDPNLGSDMVGITIRTAISFYQLDPRKGDFVLLKTLDQRTSNRIVWSPRGRHVVFATLGSTSKFELDFWDVELDRETKQSGTSDTVISKDPPTGSGVAQLNTIEHYGLTNVEWDPSGRYITASGSVWHTSIEPGFSVYDFKGTEVYKNTPLDKFKQFSWRPRPRTLLPAAQQKAIVKNLRKYGREFDEVDQLEDMNVSSELQADRRRLLDEWNTWRQRTKAALEEERAYLGKKAPASTSQEDEAVATLEEWIEEVIEETVEIVTE